MACDVKPHINFTIGTLMSLREIDLQAETYYDCENGVYDLFTQYDIDFKHYKLSLYRCSYQICTRGKFAMFYVARKLNIQRTLFVNTWISLISNRY